MSSVGVTPAGEALSPRQHRAGRLITLEGGEGSGKSTQMKAIQRMLEAIGLDVVMTREPGGTPASEALRGALLAGQFRHMGASAEAVLFAAARIIHLDEKILPALAGGAWVVCDRFIDSTRVYQGTVDGLDPHLLDVLETVALGTMRPALTLVLDVDPEVAMHRTALRRGHVQADRFEAGDLERYHRIREGFREIAAKSADRCVLIDASGDAAAVSRQIEAVIADRLFTRLRQEKWRKIQQNALGHAAIPNHL